MQFKANLYTNQSGNSPKITYESSSTSLSECGDLTAPNTIYTLANNVSSTGTCFNVMANNVTLDCGGYAINYSYAGIVKSPLDALAVQPKPVNGMLDRINGFHRRILKKIL